MGCDGNCDCKDKKDEATFSKIAELDKFIDNSATVEDDVKSLDSPIIRESDGCTAIQFDGWAIYLYDDGGWIVTDTSGG